MVPILKENRLVLGQEDFRDVYTYALRTIEALKDDFPLRDVRLVIHEADDANLKPQKSPAGGGGNSVKQGIYGTTSVYTLGGDMKLTPRHLSTIEELRREPWFFYPYSSSPPTPSPSSAPTSSHAREESSTTREGAKNFFKVGHLPVFSRKESSNHRSHYHRNKMMDAQMFGDSFFTWPYFDCRAYRLQEQQLQQQILRNSRANYYHHRQQRRDLYFTHVDQGHRAEELVRRGSNAEESSSFFHNSNSINNNLGNNEGGTSANLTHTWLASYTSWFPIGGLKENKR